MRRSRPFRPIQTPWLATLLLFLGSSCQPGSATVDTSAYVPPRSPIVLIVVDTLRGDAVHDPAGRYDTPNIDRLARDGIVFPRTFAHAPMTLPSHTALFSSRPPLETSVLNNGQDVPADLPFLGQWLEGEGYDTRAVTSLGTLPSAVAKSVSRGFKAFDARFWNLAPAENTHERLLESLAARDASKPLFLFAHYADPHEPYDAHGTEDVTADFTLDGQLLERVTTADMTMGQRTIELAPGEHVFEMSSAKPFRIRIFDLYDRGTKLETTWEHGKLMEKTRTAKIRVVNERDSTASCELKFWINDSPTRETIVARYALEVGYSDRWVGALLDELDRLGLYQQSLIVFTSDHGEALGEHNRVGHVEALTDDQIHVPLIVKLPAGDPRREALDASTNRLVPHVDVVPTVLELVGLPPLPGQRGVSLLQPHESVHIAETHEPEAKKTQLALRDERFKLVYFPGDGSFVMYDLANDPGENEDVFAAFERERPDWPERLRALARAADERASGHEELDEETRGELEALGYGGGSE